MIDYELSWLAGWLEGEGSFTFDPTISQLRVSASNTDEDVLEHVREMAGGHIYSAVKAQPHYRQPWHWHLTGPDAELLMRQLRPHMGTRRREQIDVALAAYTARRRRGSPIVLTASDEEAIRSALRAGETRTSVARRFNLPFRRVSNMAKVAA